MLAGQGKILLFGLGIGIVCFVGLAFLAVASVTLDPIRTYILGSSILILGGGGMVAFYFYNYMIAYTKQRGLGVLLAPGWGRPEGEVWIFNEIEELVSQSITEGGGQTKEPKGPEEPAIIKKPETKIKKTRKDDIVNRLEAALPEIDKEAVEKYGWRYHHYVINHTGDTKGREFLTTIRPYDSMLAEYDAELMINDFPRKMLKQAYATLVITGEHSVFQGDKEEGIKTGIWRFLKREKPRLYETVRAWYMSDSNYHRWLIKYRIGLEPVPSKEKLQNAQNLITTIDSQPHLKTIKLLEDRISRLTEIVQDKFTWEAGYSDKGLFDEENMGAFKKGGKTDWRRILLILTIIGALGVTLYFIIYRGAFQIPPGLDHIGPAIANSTAPAQPPPAAPNIQPGGV